MTYSQLNLPVLRRWCCVGWLWLIISPLAIGAQSEPNANDIRRKDQEVQLTVTVRDSFGKPVEGLKAEDFVVYAHGQQYAPVRLEQRRVPVSVVLLLDASLRQMMEKDELQSAVLAWQKLFMPEDGFAVMQFSDEVVLTQDWSNDAGALRKAVRPALRVSNKVAIYDALLLAAMKLGNADGQRLIFLLTSGLNTAGLTNMTQALTALRNTGTGISIFTQAEALIAMVRQKQSKVLRKGATIAELRDIENVLQIIARASDDLANLAEEMNGRIYFPTKEKRLQGMVEEAMRELHSQYVLTYRPQRSEPENNGIRILVRGGYVAYAQSGYPQAVQK